MDLPRNLVNNAPKCEPRPSGIHGIGLFAKARIEAGEPFMNLREGRIVPVSSYLEDAPSLIADEWNALSEETLLVRSRRTFYYCINHQPNPNCFVDLRRRQVIARVAIATDQEITLNYLSEPLPTRYLEAHGARYLFAATSVTQRWPPWPALGLRVKSRRHLAGDETHPARPSSFQNALPLRSAINAARQTKIRANTCWSL